MYHRFSEFATDERAIESDALLLQLQCLKNEYTVVSSTTQFASVDGAYSLPPCSVVLTVDDGYADFARVANELFGSFGFPVTVFVATGFVSGTYWFWWDKLRYCIDTAGVAPQDLRVTCGTGGESTVFAYDSPMLWSNIADMLLLVTPNEIEDAIAEISGQLQVDLPAVAPIDYNPLSWEQVRELESASIRFASQTESHVSLAKLSEMDCRSEVLTSLETLANETKHSPSLFCYPHGTSSDYTETIEHMLRDLGIVGAYAAHQKPDDSSQYSFPRYGVSNDLVDFEWKMCGAERIGLWLKTRFSAAIQPSAYVAASTQKDPD